LQLDERNKSVQKIPVERLEVIKKALNKNPAARFQTAEDMLGALQDQTRAH
jgi:hypothetical protein